MVPPPVCMRCSGLLLLNSLPGHTPRHCCEHAGREAHPPGTIDCLVKEFLHQALRTVPLRKCARVPWIRNQSSGACVLTSNPAVWLCVRVSVWRIAIWSATDAAKLVAAAVWRDTLSAKVPARPATQRGSVIAHSCTCVQSPIKAAASLVERNIRTCCLSLLSSLSHPCCLTESCVCGVLTVRWQPELPNRLAPAQPTAADTAELFDTIDTDSCMNSTGKYSNAAGWRTFSLSNQPCHLRRPVHAMPQ